VEFSGSLIGDNCGAVANMATSPEVWECMVERFENSAGPLSQRLLPVDLVDRMVPDTAPAA
jgi:uncharacterized Ntn-hydrolase superfamily protein